jgi:hypothetical protein
MYTEEKYEDEEDFRERARRAVRDSRKQSMEASEPSILFDEIMQTAILLEAGGTVESILRKLNVVFQGVSDPLVSLYVSPTGFGSDGALGHSRAGPSPSWTSSLEALPQWRTRMLPFASVVPLEN